MIDARAFAALLCDWCLEVTPGQQVLVLAPPAADPLQRELHRALLDRDAWPLIRPVPDWLAPDFHRHARDRHLEGFAPAALREMESIDAYLRIDAPADTQPLAGIDPVLIARAARARRPVNEERLRRRWCGTIWPTPALARRANMTEADYTAFVNRALFLDRADPAKAWQELSARQAELISRLSAARGIRIEAPGTDLRLRVEGRTWINSDGRRNMPSGEVFTGPREDSATGTIRFTVPSTPQGVDQVAGVELTFQDGVVVAARADTGEDYLRSALDSDEGARRLGEIGIGTNTGIDRATGSTLLDEKMAGTIHLALGRSYPETGGLNASAVHWDLICDLRDGGRMTVDGQVVNDNGHLVV